MIEMKKPRVSAIITTKNEESCIESCLKSLKSQLFKDFEIIISDAKSKDKTVKIASKYADRIIVKKTNVSEGRNLGAKIAKGKIQRYFKDNTLVNQAFIKDGKQSVAEYVKSVDSDLTVVGFERVALGE